MLQAFQNYEQQYSIACLRIQTEKSWQPDGTAALPFNRSRHPDLPRVTPGTRQIVQSGERRPESLLHAPSAEERDRRSSHD